MAHDLTQVRVSSTELARSVYLTISQDVVRLPGGHETGRVVVHHPGAVVILPVLADGQVILVRQYRYAAGTDLWELPAGTLEPGEEPTVTAVRELQEEAGFRPGRLTRLGEFFSAPGFCSELLHCYLAEELRPSALDGDEDEEIEILALPLAEVLAWAAAGHLRDAKTLAALCLYLQHLGGPARRP